MITDPRTRAVIDRLQSASRAQEPRIHAYFAARAAADALDWKGLDPDAHRFFADKFVALDPGKAELCHLLVRAIGARRVVEVGTSFGVSTLYLADALRANGAGEVIATEHEPDKARQARAHFAEAGVADLVDLRERDLRGTLRRLPGPVDFVLMDIWTEVVRPAMECIAPYLRRGSVIVCDNTDAFRDAYADYFAFVAEGPYDTRTLPFPGGLELTVRR